MVLFFCRAAFIMMWVTLIMAMSLGILIGMGCCWHRQRARQHLNDQHHLLGQTPVGSVGLTPAGARACKQVGLDCVRDYLSDMVCLPPCLTHRPARRWCGP